jgi:anaerobic magnesium-protoporphyrin IX monomethyl ester cyclase
MEKRILFVQPPFERFMGYSRFYIHPGLLSLASVVEAASHKATIYDADYNPNGISYSPLEMHEKYGDYINGLIDPGNDIWLEIKQKILDFKPDFLGITVLTPTLASAKVVINIAKSIDKNIQIITGGVHATLCPEDLTEVSDYIIQFEGEAVIVDIIEGKLNKGIIVGKRIEDLNSLPLPALHLVDGLEKYKKRDLSMIMSTRGCPNNCKFCNSSQIWDRHVTRKNVDRFIEEIYMLKNDYHVTDFYISDDSFTYNKKWLKSFCEKIKELNITWRCLARIDQVDEEIIDLMILSGCRNIKFGIESGSQKILDLINKKIKLENVIKVSDMLQRKNMLWSAYFIIGFPGETQEDIYKTQELIKKISASSITISIFTPFPRNKLCDIKNLNYNLYSHHSPNNNFTGTISNNRFRELVQETLKLAAREYTEHTNEST